MDTKKKTKSGDSFKVVISNLRKDVTESELNDVFSTCGQIKVLKIAKDKAHGNECKGYCHIEFTTKEAMDAALAADLKLRVQGQIVTVRIPGASQNEAPLIDLGINNQKQAALKRPKESKSVTNVKKKRVA